MIDADSDDGPFCGKRLKYNYYMLCDDNNNYVIILTKRLIIKRSVCQYIRKNKNMILTNTGKIIMQVYISTCSCSIKIKLFLYYAISI